MPYAVLKVPRCTANNAPPQNDKINDKMFCSNNLKIRYKCLDN